ncbi:hypothetical protein BJY24_000996 [Nocardia transvalensis]|uniref:DUF4185 domain-containing protein n=1 Tax=Nocardia transvalensis TaxID=37333 RepID=A0A7W9P9S6_9NOCA|nr:DUF4185 domain-containing protein [Nocardia transvalensis]MBB5912129.1 hypothetical protein [Nocardia transvalensis]
MAFDREVRRWATVRRPLRLLVLVVLSAAGLGLVVPWPVPALTAPAVVDARPLSCLDAALTRYGNAGSGWTGGDSTWSAALPEGREVFAFSDTFLPPVHPPGRPPDAGFVHNSFVVREADGRLSTVVGGTAERPAAVLAPPDPGHWFWLGAVTYPDGALQVPVTEWRSTGPGSLDIEFAGSSVARFDAHDLRRPISVTPLPRDRGIQWGQWVQPDGPRTYVYGVETAGDAKYLHVARVDGGDLRHRFSFWTGRGWSDDEADSARITDGINAEFSVHRVRAGVYLLVTMQGGAAFSDRLIGRYAPSPTGPFGPATTLYVTPETGAAGSYRDPDVYTYNAHVHPEFSTPTRLVVSYNVNSIDTAPGGDVYRQVSIYRPRTVLVTLRGETGDAPRAACP